LPVVKFDIIHKKQSGAAMVGPAVPEEIQRIREARFSASKSSSKNNNGKEKIKQFFNPTQSVNDELKTEIMSSMKTVNDRFEK
jgi:hypothetical protein